MALVVTGLVAGGPARAGVGPSQDCRAGAIPGAPTYVELLDTGAYAGVRYGLPDPHDFSVNVCVSDRPYGTPSLLAGGIVHLRFFRIGPDTYDVYLDCAGDTTVIGTPNNCDGAVSTTTTVHLSPGVGGSTSAFVQVESSTLFVGTTGADSGTTTNSTGSNPAVTYGNTCATVAGIALTGSCSGDALEASLASDDVTPAVGGTTGTCLVWAGASCLLDQPRAGVVLFNDTANDTQVKLLEVPVLTDPRARQCYGSC